MTLIRFILAAALAAAVQGQTPPANCRTILSRLGLTFNASLTQPAELSSLNPGAQGLQADWSGKFDVTRSGFRVIGTTINSIYPSAAGCAGASVASAMLYQTARVTTPITMTTYVSYCPINITYVPPALVATGITAPRWNIWWGLDNSPQGAVAFVQCMALARLPDANGGGVMMSFQGNDGVSCPSDPIIGQSFSPATYTRALTPVVPNSCAGAGAVASAARGPSVALAAALAAVLGAALMLAA